MNKRSVVEITSDTVLLSGVTLSNSVIQNSVLLSLVRFKSEMLIDRADEKPTSKESYLHIFLQRIMICLFFIIRF